ncbi:hypothetical protein [Burkholderia ubonensis]|uniref:hypothetical protein n=1 Tax=Burkholderia ubonensis TaxID=101571 RepID=UPI000A8DDAA5|nr:hypothetical protein [Burkholderia ubonensis]
MSGDFNRQSKCGAALATVLMWPMLAAAQQPLVECGDSSQTYKLLLDQFAYTDPALSSDPELGPLPQRLQWNLSNNEKMLELENQRVPYQAIWCKGRSPRDGSAFNSTVTDALNSSNVMLEVWGTLDAKIAHGHVSDRVARLGYTIIPVRFYESAGPAGLSGIYQVEYAGSPGQPGQLMVNLLGQAQELKAYWKVAVGIKAMKANAYDVARGYLCQAAVEMRAVKRPDNTLTAYVQQSAAKVVDAARKDATYRGSLKLVGADQPCS